MLPPSSTTFTVSITAPKDTIANTVCAAPASSERLQRASCACTGNAQGPAKQPRTAGTLTTGRDNATIVTVACMQHLTLSLLQYESANQLLATKTLEFYTHCL